jgi:hypothetical protein
MAEHLPVDDEQVVYEAHGPVFAFEDAEDVCTGGSLKGGTDMGSGTASGSRRVDYDVQRISRFGR